MLYKIIKLCKDNYNKETFEHCVRVAGYAIHNVCLQLDKDMEMTFVFAMCHDLLEDTDVTVKDIVEITGYDTDFVENVLGALTKKKDETYIEYIKRLKSNENMYPYIVKLADMKDHLSQTETLTDKLKEKYWEALPYLL